MKTSHSLLILLSIFLAIPAAFAAKAAGPKAKVMAQFDLNHDGKLDATEISAVRKAFAAAPTGELQRFDKDKDGQLSEDEVAAMVPGSGRKSRPSDKSEAEPKKSKAGSGEKSGSKVKADAAEPK